jgi:hypothetical protein
MTLPGLEHPAKTSKKPRSESRGGAQTGAAGLTQPRIDPDLARVVEAWATLPDHIRAAIRALVGAVVGPTE